jgi:hypothetical protein
MTYPGTGHFTHGAAREPSIEGWLVAVRVLTFWGTKTFLSLFGTEL